MEEINVCYNENIEKFSKEKGKCILKHKIVKLLVVLSILLLGRNISVMAENSIQINSVGVNQNRIKVVGKTEAVTETEVSCIVTDESGNVVYLYQVSSDDAGNFIFDFSFADNVENGTYTVRCNCSGNASPAIKTFEYIATVKEPAETNFMCGEINVNISSYVPVISGTISCGNSNSLIFSLVNKSDNAIIVSENITSENGEVFFSYTLPSLLRSKEYEFVLSWAKNEKIFSDISVNINASILALEIVGDVNTAPNVEIDATLQSANTGLIDKSFSCSESKSVSVTIPNILANASFDLSFMGYELGEDIPEPSEPEKNEFKILNAGINQNGNMTVSGTTPNTGDIITCVITDSDGIEVFSAQGTANGAGNFSFVFEIPVWVENGDYLVRCSNESASVETIISYNKAPMLIEPINIDKSTNKELYNALKAECRHLDSDKDGVITVAELNNLTGSIDLSNRNIRDINGLQSLTQVSSIYLNNNKIEDISVLTNLSNLLLLDVSDNDIAQLNTIPKNLKTLNLQNNNITNIYILGKCRNMEYLFADNNNISDIKSLKTMKSLKTLSMSKNSINNISSLSNLINVRYLNLSSNLITDITPLSYCAALKDIRLSYNKITDITSLPDKLFSTVYIEGNSIPALQKNQLRSIVKKY